MRRNTASYKENYRLLKAVAVTLALVVAAPGADAVVRFVVGPQTAVAANGENALIDSSSLLDAGDAFASLDRIERIAATDDVVVPREFTCEIGLLPDAHDVRVSVGGGVVGYVVDDECENVLTRLGEHMESRGWTEVSLGGVSGATFVKKDGSCRWALATCMQAGGATSVVVRCVVE